MKQFVYIIIIGMLFSSCQREVNPELEGALNALVIDAWLTDVGTQQSINVTRSQSYFENSAPPKASGATVVIRDLTNPANGPFEFEETASTYTWVSPDGRPLGVIGNEYELTVALDGVTYTSTTTLNPVCEIDSIAFRLEPATAFFEDLFFAEFFATDLEGPGDTYWIKSWKNGVFLGRPQEINIAFDAGFSEGGLIDNTPFIQPIRDAINIQEEARNGDFLSPMRLPDTLLVRQSNQVFTTEEELYGRLEGDRLIFDTDLVAKDLIAAEIDGDFYRLSNDTIFVKGDSIYVEIHSISNEAHFFLTQVVTETTREGGFGALFATPLANVATNITPSDRSSRVAGFFNMASVASKGRRLNSKDELRILN